MKMLVVDDDAVSRRVMTTIIREHLGCAAIEIASGASALSAVEREMPAIVLLDIAMPGLSGLEVLATMRANPATADVPVIMVSGVADVENVKKAMRLGIADFITKPILPDRLQQQVRKLLAGPRRAVNPTA